MKKDKPFIQDMVADPGNLSDELRDHLARDDDSRALHEAVVEFDEAMRAALDVDVPEGLGNLDALLARDSAQDTSGQNVVPLRKPATASTPIEPRSNKPLFALAASLLLGVGALFGVQLGKISTDLPEAMVAHVDHEPHLLSGDWSTVPAFHVQSVLNRGNVSLKGDIGTVRHAGLCSFRGNNVAHVVVQSSNGPVTLMLLPDEKTRGIQSFEEEGYSGVLIPVGDGSIAIIGNDEQSTEEVRQNVTDKVAWTI
ncbi:MAG: DUF3379 family protein [Pseudomonadota bacterium]